MTKVELNVGDLIYYVSYNRIKAFPASYFAVALSETWQKETDANSNARKQLRIEGRNADLFQHIVDFLNYGCVPRGKDGDCLMERGLLKDLRFEADYFCLHELVAEIDGLLSSDNPQYNFWRDGIQFYDCMQRDNLRIIGKEMVSKEDFRDSRDKSCRSLEAFMSLSESLTGAYKAAVPFVVAGEIDWCKTCDIAKLIADCNNYFKTLSWDVDYEEKPVELFPTFMMDSLDYFLNEGTILNNTRNLQLDCVALLDTEDKHGPDLSKLDTSLKYLIVVLPTEHKGGEITIASANSETINTDMVSANNVFKFIIIQEDCKIDVAAVTEGRQVLILFGLYSPYEKIELNLKPCEVKNVFCVDTLNNKLLSENKVLELVNSILKSEKFLGLYLEKDYIEVGLREETLIGFDATLYGMIRSMNIPISLCNAVTLEKYSYDFDEGSFEVALLKDQLDNRLEIHKSVENLTFVRPTFECGRLLSEDSYGGKHSTEYIKRTVKAVLIIGGQNN